MEFHGTFSMEFCLVLGMEFHGMFSMEFHGKRFPLNSIKNAVPVEFHGIPWNNWNNFYEKLFPWNI